MQGMLHRLSDGSEEESPWEPSFNVGSLPIRPTDQQLQELFRATRNGQFGQGHF